MGTPQPEGVATRRADRDVTQQDRDRRIASEQGQRIVRAARELIAEEGVDAASTRRVGRAVGMTSARGPIYYVGSQGRLLIEVLSLDQAEWIAALQAEVDEAATRGEYLDALERALYVNAKTASGRRHRELVAEIEKAASKDGDLHARLQHLRNEQRHVIAESLRTKSEQGVVTVTVPVDSAAGAITALADGLAPELAGQPAKRGALSAIAARVMIEALIQPPTPSVE
jgi:AcrR family transcriptional regulator